MLRSLTVSGLDCAFDKTVCDYSVSNTSTGFAFSNVLDINSVGKLHQTPSSVRVSSTVNTRTRCPKIDFIIVSFSLSYSLKEN